MFVKNKENSQTGILKLGYEVITPASVIAYLIATFLLKLCEFIQIFQ